MNRNAFSMAIGILTLAICSVALRAGVELTLVMATGIAVAYWLSQPALPRQNEAKVNTLEQSGQ